MALHDISKDRSNRVAPAPNVNDKVVDRLAHGTTQNHNTGEEALSDGLKFKERQILARQDGFDKAVYGFDPATSMFVLKVAEDGVDVLSATDNQLVFNSAQNVFKIVGSGTVSLPSFAFNTGGAQFKWDANPLPSTAIVHGLSYIPAFIAFESSGGAAYSLVGKPRIESASPSAGFIQTWIDVATDATKIYFTTTAFGYNINTTALGSSVKYYLLQETAN